MNKKFLVLFALIMLIMPIGVKALENGYVDKASQYTLAPVEDGKVNVYLFRGEECMYCARELAWIEMIKEQYADVVNFYSYEVWHDEANNATMRAIKKEFGMTEDDAVPFTVIGDKNFPGFGPGTDLEIENTIRGYLGLSLLDKPSATIFSDTGELLPGILDDGEPEGDTAPTPAVAENNNATAANNVQATTSSSSSFVNFALVLIAVGFFCFEVMGTYYLYIAAKRLKDAPYMVDEVKDKKKASK